MHEFKDVLRCVYTTMEAALSGHIKNTPTAGNNDVIHVPGILITLARRPKVLVAVIATVVGLAVIGIFHLVSLAWMGFRAS